jgi:membrane protease YdiL (CAAX protease family)
MSNNQFETPEQILIRPAPIIKMLGITIIVALAVVLIYAMIRLLPNYETIVEYSSWLIADLVHIPQFAIPFVIIIYITGGNLSKYGFNLKTKSSSFTHIRMLGLGVLFGFFMSLPSITQFVMSGSVDVPQPVNAGSFLGNMTFQWIVVGLAEETMFRGLIQTYLMINLMGYIKIMGHSLHIGTVIGAIIWGLFHFINILIMPLSSVVFTVVLTTMAGLLMGYAYQKTGSLFTTIIIHNTLFGVPLTVSYFLYWLL